MTFPRFQTLVLALSVAVWSAASAQQAGDAVVVPLTDPDRPALVNVDLLEGSITVRGTDRRDVLVTQRSRSDNRRRREPPAASGLRRLSQSAGLEISEERNEVTIEADSPNRPGDVEILVPMRTNLKLETVNGGEIVVENVDGEIEVENTNGSITLRQVSGSVAANTTNGHVKAAFGRIASQKAMAFTSLNGNVDVTFPAALKANLRLRSDNGDVYSDFDVQLRPGATTTEPNRRGRGRVRIEVNTSLYGTVGGGGPEIELRSFNGNVYLRKGQ